MPGEVRGFWEMSQTNLSAYVMQLWDVELLVISSTLIHLLLFVLKLNFSLDGFPNSKLHSGLEILVPQEAQKQRFPTPLSIAF